MARVYQTYWQLLVRRDSPIASVADVAGLRMSLGPDGSGTQFTARRILSAAGLAPTDIAEVPMTVTDSGVPSSTKTSTRHWSPEGCRCRRSGGCRVEAELIGLQKETSALIREYGAGYFPVRIPSGVYGTTGATASLGVSSLLVCSPNVPDEAVGQVVVRLLIDYPDRSVPEQTLGTQYLNHDP